MKERISELKKLCNNGVSYDTFQKLILHCTDGSTDRQSQYGNNLNIEGWKKLFTEPSIEISISESHLKLFFEYVTKRHSLYFGKNKGNYTVNKSLFFDREKESLFQFEQIVLLTCEL